VVIAILPVFETRAHWLLWRFLRKPNFTLRLPSRQQPSYVLLARSPHLWPTVDILLWLSLHSFSDPTFTRSQRIHILYLIAKL
jgi:hypothetical protein